MSLFPVIDKRAVSPITATLLVILLAILLGFLSTNFLRELPVQPIHCEKFMDLRVEKSSQGEPQLCIDKEARVVHYILKNHGDESIEGYNILLIGNTKDTIDKNNNALAPKDLVEDSFDYDLSIGDIKRMEFKPYIIPGKGNAKTLCQRSILILYDFPVCDENATALMDK